MDESVGRLGDSWILARLSPEDAERYHVTPRHRGAIIGEVDIVDCQFRFPDELDRLYSKWAAAVQYGFTLANPVLYEKPIPCRGHLGFFEREN